MRISRVFYVPLLTTFTFAFLVPPGFFSSLPRPFRAVAPSSDPDSPHPDNLQAPMNPGPVQPPTSNNPSNTDNSRDGDSSLTISDILPKTRSINIFASLTRDVSGISGRLESTLPGDNTTLLAPLNSVMQNLPRKPWEDRPDDNSGVRAESNSDKAAENIQKFVEEHVVPTSPWTEGEEGKIKTVGGQELWWERRDGKRVIMPGDLEVDGVLGRVGNGEIWAVKGVVNYR